MLLCSKLVRLRTRKQTELEIGKLGVKYVEKSGNYFCTNLDTLQIYNAAMKGVTQVENFKRFRRQLYISRDS